MLLVLDNFEQVLDAAQALPRLLAECPHLVILASSREPLGSSWEQQFHVTPLAPEAAVDLFVLQARTVRPSFALS